MIWTTKMEKKNSNDYEAKRNELIQRFSDVGIKVNKETRKVKNNQFSGIISNNRKILKLNIPSKFE
jgi:hypothetical protein